MVCIVIAWIKDDDDSFVGKIILSYDNTHLNKVSNTVLGNERKLHLSKRLTNGVKFDMRV